MKPKRRIKYRTGVNTKTLKQLNVRVPDEIHDMVESLIYDENGCKLAKDKVVADMITFAASRMGKPKRI